MVRNSHSVLVHIFVHILGLECPTCEVKALLDYLQVFSKAVSVGQQMCRKVLEVGFRNTLSASTRGWMEILLPDIFLVPQQPQTVAGERRPSLFLLPCS